MRYLCKDVSTIIDPILNQIPKAFQTML